MLTLGVLFTVLTRTTPLGPWLEQQGMSMTPLLVISAFWGMGGAFVSLMISRWMAKKATGAEVLNPATAKGDELWLLQTVHRLAKDAGISTMPEVAVYPAAEVNAFATGATKNSSLVAVSEGLLSSMNKGEIEGVLAHEVSHISNGDMVTLTLVQGVVNSFVMFISWLITIAISQAMRRDGERREGFGDFMMRSMIHNLVSMLLMFAAHIMVIAPFSRWREFRADAGGAKRAGTLKMINALEALKGLRTSKVNQTAEAEASAAQPALAAFKISGSWASLLSTHPPLEERIKALKQSTMRGI
jgi:heat shock protein HtpX